MELRFIPPDLRQLDLMVSEVLAVPLAVDERPPQGTAGLVDYRLAGKLSKVIISGALTGGLGEKVLIPGRPKLTFDKVLVYGCGELDAFNPQVFHRLIELLLSTLQDMDVRRAVVELPGRATGRVSPEEAVQIVLEKATKYPSLDTWTLVDTPEAQRAAKSVLRRDARNQWGV